MTDSKKKPAPTLRDEDILVQPMGRRSFLSKAGIAVAGLGLVGAGCPPVSDDVADSGDPVADTTDQDATDTADADTSDSDTGDPTDTTDTD